MAELGFRDEGPLIDSANDLVGAMASEQELGVTEWGGSGLDKGGKVLRLEIIGLELVVVQIELEVSGYELEIMALEIMVVGLEIEVLLIELGVSGFELEIMALEVVVMWLEIDVEGLGVELDSLRIMVD